jgi:hypothetical protein
MMIDNLSFVKGLKELTSSVGFLEKLYETLPGVLSASNKKILFVAFQLWNTEKSPFPKAYEIIMQQKLQFEYFLENPHLKFLVAPENGKVLGQLSFTGITDLRGQLGMNIQLAGLRSFQQDKENIDPATELFSDQHTKIEHPGLKQVLVRANRIDQHRTQK